MKKIIVGCVVLALVLVVPISSSFIASELKQEIRAFVATVDQTPQYKAKIVDFESSLFKSSGRVQIMIDPSILEGVDAIAAEDFVFDVDVDVRHGPIIFGGEALFGLAEMNLTLMDSKLRDYLSWTENTPLYSGRLFVDMSERFEYREVVQPFTVFSKEHAFNLKYEGYQSQVYSENGSWSYTGKSKPLTMEGVFGDVVIGEADIRYKSNTPFQTMIGRVVYDLDGDFDVSSISFNDAGANRVFTIKNMGTHTSTTLFPDRNVVDSKFELSIGTLDAGGTKATDLTWAVEANNIDIATLEALYAFLQENKEVAPKVSLVQFQDNLLPLLKAKPEFNITSLRGTIEQGTIEASMNTGVANVVELPESLEDPAFWLAHLFADVKVEGDKAAVNWLAFLWIEAQLIAQLQGQGMSAQQMEKIVQQQTLQMMQMLVVQGFVVSDDVKYLSQLKLKDGVLTVNENVIPL